MNDIKTLNGIVLRGVEYGDFDKILTIYTVEEGKISAMAKGVKKPAAKLKHAAQPLVFGEFDLMPSKAGSNKLISARPADTFFDIHKKTENYFAAAAVLELLDAFGTETADPPLFLLSLKVIRNLCYEDTPAYVVMSEFLTELLKITGFGAEEIDEKNRRKTVFNCAAKLCAASGSNFRALQQFLSVF